MPVLTESDAPNRPSVAIGYNTSHYAWLLRSNLIKALQTAGYSVVVLAPRDAYTKRLLDLGVSYFEIPIAINTNPFSDLLLFSRFYRMLRKHKPSIYLGFTVKPNVYGSLAAHALHVPVINNISGLGVMFINRTFLTRVVLSLYRFALSRSAKVFFQNEDDRRMFISSRVVRKSVAGRLPGSGVDLERYAYIPSPSQSGRGGAQFLLIARMLWDKGVGEYVEAARLLKPRYPHAEFCLLGFLDVQNPAAISHAQMDEWVAEGNVRYLGCSDDVRPYIAHADCIVLPSYREGLSRSLLESAAIGRPIVTTDVVGCREVVEDGSTGFRCRVRDSADLAAKMESILLLTPAERGAMGRRGREKVEREFDEQLVIDTYLETIAENLR